MAQLNAAISPAVRSAVTLYARPLTKDGLRVMTKHRFVQVSDGRSAPQIGLASTLKDRKKEIGRDLLAKMCRDLNIDPHDL
jgi:hypothetical protein